MITAAYFIGRVVERHWWLKRMLEIRELMGDNRKSMDELRDLIRRGPLAESNEHNEGTDN